ncbi:MAG: hypothetical protein V4660_17010 [Pseudomonadota bacterium]
MSIDEEKYLKDLDLSKLPHHAPAVLVAIAQTNENKPVTATCPKCFEKLKVEPRGIPPTAWVHFCTCGLCNGTFRGL